LTRRCWLARNGFRRRIGSTVIAAGARFYQPVLRLGVVKYAHATDLAVSWCSSQRRKSAAWKAGAACQASFPAPPLGGPSFVRNHQSCPAPARSVSQRVCHTAERSRGYRGRRPASWGGEDLVDLHLTARGARRPIRNAPGLHRVGARRPRGRAQPPQRRWARPRSRSQKNVRPRPRASPRLRPRHFHCLAG